jgi:hypothetical protein
MKRKASDQRTEERVRTLLPVKMQGETAIARDVSASAIFFETDAKYDVGSPVNLALDLDTPWGKVMLRCAGQIVRVEQRDDTVGVAVKFDERGAAKPAQRRSSGKRA